MKYILIKKQLLLLVMISTIPLYVFGQQGSLYRVEPLSWWTGMENPKLQLLVHGKNIADSEVVINHSGVQVVKVHKADHPNYVFVDLEIDPGTQPGTFPITFQKNRKKIATYNYTLQQKGFNSGGQQGLNGSDVIYLITPDRFVNGDKNNDVVKGMKEGISREKPGGRHGGDIAGVLSKLDYLEDLGITALWLNPVLENNMPEYSYHGYATTDFYKVDPRYGSNELYKKLADELHQRDMKLVMDMIFNHSGVEHWWMKEIPFKDWINGYPDYFITNHAIGAVSDPYSAAADLDTMEKGWFVPTMPDLNHKNPFMANYLIQNSIWWIEYAGLDGIRMDTYPYNNKEMMVEWVHRVKTEYPDFFLLGETWVHNEPQEAFWAGKDPENKTVEYNSFLTSITDFPFCYAIHNSFKKEGNVYDLYANLTKDFLYYKPESNTTFTDNHDMDRTFHVLGEDLDKFKMAMTYLLTSRGIPQLYYGTEILLKGKGDHGVIREDFPGGWEGDSRNAFEKEGRTEEENEAFEYLKALLNFRKNSKAIQEGTFQHFIPNDNIYVFNRKSGDESLMVIINNNNNAVELPTERYQEIIKGCTQAVNALTGEELKDISMISVKNNSSIILKLKP